MVTRHSVPAPPHGTHITALPGEDEILAAALEVATAVRGGRSFPPIRSQEWLDLPHDDKVAALLPLACAWLLEDPRRADRALMAEASSQVRAGMDWGRHADTRVTHTELVRRRAWPVAS